MGDRVCSFFVLALCMRAGQSIGGTCESREAEERELWGWGIRGLRKALLFGVK